MLKEHIMEAVLKVKSQRRKDRTEMNITKRLFWIKIFEAFYKRIIRNLTTELTLWTLKYFPNLFGAQFILGQLQLQRNL